MSGVALRDLVELGAVSFGDKDFSRIVKEQALKEGGEGIENIFRKFDLVDNADDRKKMLGWVGVGGLQQFLADPSTQNLYMLLRKTKEAPSSRNARIFPLNESLSTAYWEFGSKHMHRIFNKPDISNEQMENVVNEMVRGGDMEKNQGQKFKQKNLGMNFKAAERIFGKGLARNVLGNGFMRWLRTTFHDDPKKERQVKGGLLRLIMSFLAALFLSSTKELGKGSFDAAKEQTK